MNPLSIIGKHGKVKKSDENLIIWWEIGKVHIRDFCQQTLCLKRTLECLEKEILVIEENMMRKSVHFQEWTDKKSKLSSILNETVKGSCEE